MPVFDITYHTLNNYSSVIDEAVLEFLVFPAKLPNQKVDKIRIKHEPSSSYYIGENMFGFEFLRFRCKNLKNSFSFTLKASVTKEIINPFEFQALSWEDESQIIASNEYLIDNYLFLKNNEYTSIPDNFLFPSKGKKENVYDYVLGINQFVHSEIKYDNSIEDPKRLLKDTIREKKGVCQDLAHLMAAILRKNKIPTRYVSGYLNPGENVVGASAIHAWVEVLIPGAGWIGFDPTNNLLEDYHYIKIAHGVDINDCSILKGVIKGQGSNETSYHVLIEEQNNEINQ